MKPSRWIFGIILGICVYAIFVLFSDVSLLIEQLENRNLMWLNEWLMSNGMGYLPMYGIFDNIGLIT